MSTKSLLLNGFLAGFLVFAAGPVLAQTAQPGNLDERFRSQVYDMSPEQRASDALMSGDSDLLLLRRTRLFDVHAGYARSGTDNAGLSPEDPVDDHIGVFDAGLHAGTVIGGRVQVYADVSMVLSKYDDNRSLNYSAVTGAVGVATRLWGVDLNAAYMPSIVYGDEFRQRQLNQDRIAVTASTGWRLGRLSIQPELSYDRTTSDPEDYDNSTSAARLTLAVPFKTKRPLMVYLTGGVSHRVYDHYFPDLVGVKRKDNGQDVSVGARWTISRTIDLSAQYTWQRNRSTSDVNGYKATSGQIGVRLSHRF